MKLRRLDRTGVYALAARTARARRRAANADAGRRRSVRRRAGHLDGRRTVDAAVPRRLLSQRSGQRARAALRQHGRQFRGEPGRPGVQAARSQRDRQPQGSVGPRRHRLRGGTAPRRPRLRTPDRRRRRRLRNLLQSARPLRRDVRRCGVLPPPVAHSTASGPDSCSARAASGCGWSRATIAPRVRARKSSAWPPPERRSGSTCGPTSRSRWCARCGWRSRTPGCRRRTSTSSTRRRMPRAGLDATEADALSAALRRQQSGRHVGQGRARRIRRVRRRRLRRGVPVRPRGTGAADCGPGEHRSPRPPG